MPYKIEAVVEFNDGESLVLNKYPELRYERNGNMLIGIDDHGAFAGCYKYDEPSEHFQAFGGREFDIPMMDGSVIKANGQWWDYPSLSFSVSATGASNFWREVLGGDMVCVTIETKIGLKNCYVFHGGFWMDKEEFKKLRQAYTGKVYGYEEYQEILKNKSVNVAG